jgi:hypothetical protein
MDESQYVHNILLHILTMVIVIFIVRMFFRLISARTDRTFGAILAVTVLFSVNLSGGYILIKSVTRDDYNADWFTTSYSIAIGCGILGGIGIGFVTQLVLILYRNCKLGIAPK